MVSRRWIDVAVLGAAAVIAAVSARPYAGGWNDGSRLATVEALVDHHTWAIDNSIFVDVPARGSPYPPGDALLNDRGTLDRMRIDGRYFSDKPPVLSLLLAGGYQAWRWCGGPSARQAPTLFCYAMTVLSSGVAYVVAVWCIYRIGVLLLSFWTGLLLTASFGLATVALPYAQHVNNHIVLLAVAAALMLALLRLAREERDANWLVCWIGVLAGLAYTLDLGVGPVLVLCVTGLIAYRTRSMRAVAFFLLSLAPWLVLHHAINFHIGGTLAPANSRPEYFAWPGSPFAAGNMTGVWHHDPLSLVVYALALLGGKRGFLGHSLPLFLVLPALVVLWKQRPREWPEVVCAAAWCVGAWLLFATQSNNYSGPCCGIRWFVPLLAPGYLILGVFISRHPAYAWDLAVLSAWGAVLTAVMWWHGPWMPRHVPGFWPVQAAAFLCWYLCRRRLDRAAVSAAPRRAPVPSPA